MVDFILESFSYLQGKMGSRGARGNRVRRFRSCCKPGPPARELTLTLYTTVHYILLSNACDQRRPPARVLTLYTRVRMYFTGAGQTFNIFPVNFVAKMNLFEMSPHFYCCVY